MESRELIYGLIIKTNGNCWVWEDAGVEENLSCECCDHRKSLDPQIGEWMRWLLLGCLPAGVDWCCVKAYLNCFPSFLSSSILQIPRSFSKIHKGLLLLLKGLKISLSPFFYLKMRSKRGIEWEDVKMSDGSNHLPEHVSIKPKQERVKQLLGDTITRSVCCLYVDMYHLKLHSAIYL